MERRLVALLSLKHRLTLELKVPAFARSHSGKHTMACARHWTQSSARTRKAMLTTVTAALKEYECATPSSPF